jgi:two-component system chemotaxis response regulator CheY
MRKRILLVDDTVTITALEKLLLGRDFDYLEARNGAEAIAKARSSKPDLILMDLNMPVMNGIEFIRKYRQHPMSKGVPIILLTTESDETLKAEARAAGATGWIVKPFKQDQLVAVIKKVTGA